MVDGQKPKRKITWQEVQHHSTYDNAWLVIHHKVYDISKWDSHPGGMVMLSHAGEDATDIFSVYHPTSSWKLLDQFYIGDVDESTRSDDKSLTEAQKAKKAKTDEFISAYRRLRVQIKGLGLYDANMVFYVWKFLSTLSIWMASVAICWHFDTWPMYMLAACIMGLFWQQSGWLAHDVLHHQIWENHLFGNIMGVIIGDIWMGFSVQWWKNKHNFHHALPNLVGNSKTKYFGDPDIDTMPLLAWSKHMASRAYESSWGPFFVRYQAIIYFPLLLFARFSWLLQSYYYVFHNFAFSQYDPLDLPNGEKVGLIVHYAWNLLLPIVTGMSLAQGLAFFMIAQMSCGAFLAAVFSVGHNGMSVYEREEKPHFWELQVSTTRNITPGFFIDWFCGGLNYQIEHHLFPLLPRHSLQKVNPLVKSLCKEYGLRYYETGFYRGLVEVVDELAEISKEFLLEFPAM
ncbi:delta-6 fatty acid desaturase [Plasmopara halstedii]|uniref:Delta-6 fatty acid desaturase n=1 Tax=Plasmopara halstedii TaxID=4781 RepID=A0A0N7L444_PLAHL|nr:delta-6 fatty acid desaturase [Plasmopara halstedii]CEG37643.1 delta-6 fatty acid desaturase [Plasmopara halstedii]|eukprot:XP_024574012.1 delta-6 fatty acid desaturase [Plasmopara halstedii]